MEAEDVVEQQPADEHQQHHQRVHTCLFGVPHGEGRERNDGDGDPSEQRAAPTATDEERQRQAEQTEDAGERTDCDVGGAEDVHPAVEQQVVERRMTVVAKCLQDVRRGEVVTIDGGTSHDRQLRDVDGERFVEPHRRPCGESEDCTQPHRDSGEDDDVSGCGGALVDLRCVCVGRTDGLRERAHVGSH